MNNKLYFRVGNAFVTDMTFKADVSRITHITLRDFDYTAHVKTYGCYEMELSNAQKRRNQISELLGGADVDIVRIVDKPTVEVVE